MMIMIRLPFSWSVLALAAVWILPWDPALALTAHRTMLQVRPVSTPRDVLELGDLRYQEWMPNEEGGGPSRMAFRRATAEVQSERAAQNSLAFLARTADEEVAGTAELSSIELMDCYNVETSQCCYWYVTDVVTARTHRRKGVATTLMKALECRAVVEERRKEHQSTVFLLHVERDNEAALAFYRALGYRMVGETNSLEGLNVDRLAENASVTGQCLLCKTVDSMAAVPEHSSTKKRSSTTGEGGKGFGRKN